MGQLYVHGGQVLRCGRRVVIALVLLDNSGEHALRDSSLRINGAGVSGGWVAGRLCKAEVLSEWWNLVEWWGANEERAHSYTHTHKCLCAYMAEQWI